jgi:hypothetical protein
LRHVTNLGMGFFFLSATTPQTLHVRSRQLDYLLQNFHHFVHSFDVGKINRMDHAILDRFTAGNLPPSRFADIFLSPTFQLSSFLPPLGDHFSIFSDTLRAPNSPLPPLSTLCHFTWQLLSAVAKVTSSVFWSSFRIEHISPFSFTFHLSDC